MSTKTFARLAAVPVTFLIATALIYTFNLVGAAAVFFNGVLVGAVIFITIVAVSSRVVDNGGTIAFAVSLVHSWLILLIGCLTFAIWTSSRDVFFWLLTLQSGPTTAIVGVCLVLLFGTALFIFRIYFRAVYGLTEVLVGVAICAHRFSKDYERLTAADVDFYVFFLTASVYLVVRGLDNMHQGVTKDPIDMLYSKLSQAASTGNSSQVAPEQQQLIEVESAAETLAQRESDRRTRIEPIHLILLGLPLLFALLALLRWASTIR